MKKEKVKKVLASSAMGIMALAMPFTLTGCDKDSDINVRVDGEYVQWQIEGEDSWTNLLTIDEIKDLLGDSYKGDKGDPGINGRDVEFRVDSGYIQWSYVGEGLWKNLLEISSINSNNNETIKSINVCYHMNGGENPDENTSTKLVNKNNMIDLAVPTKNGFTFVDWYLDNECTKIFDSVCKDNIDDNNTLCLYAKWTTDYTIEDDVFVSMNDKNITSFVIPERVTTIKDYAFQNCDNLQEITIPDSVTKIGFNIFYDSSDEPIKINYNGTLKQWISSLHISTSSTSFLNHDVLLYMGGRSITTIQNEDIEEIDRLYNLSNICNLENVWIGQSQIDRINAYTFSDCKNLSNILLGNNVIEIGAYAFSGCTSLSRITIPESVNHIERAAFNRCDSLYNSSCITFKDKDGYKWQVCENDEWIDAQESELFDLVKAGKELRRIAE